MDIIDELKKMRMAHYECEDGYFSCPKSDEGCLNEGVGDICTCGADDHNIRLDKIINRLIRIELRVEKRKEIKS